MHKSPQSAWMDLSEQEEFVYNGLLYGYIKFSNKRDLPLKGGGSTDIYISLRDARNHPEAIRFITSLYENPLRRLDIDRFAEVPDSVSCFAGLLEDRTGIPYITIREEVKEGRVTKGKVIGDPRFGERVALLDDVITDGASKIVPWRECKQRGLIVPCLIVAVDRQQGWQRKFAQEGIELPVWAGMTLHDIRRLLIQNLVVMERCDKTLEEKNPIIVALDGKNWDGILPIIDRLRITGCILKVNDLLIAEGSDWLLPNLEVYGRVMADIKGHDIPNTLQNIAQHLVKNPPWAVTVHGSGGRDMIKAVVETLKGTPTKILVVTVLTSFDPDTCEEIYRRQPWDQVELLAKIGADAGTHGFVCSPEEAPKLSWLYPKKILVTPGVRSPGKDTGDQKRIGTPAGALKDGANYIVMGRQILGAPDPVAEVMRILRDELQLIA